MSDGAGAARAAFITGNLRPEPLSFAPELRVWTAHPGSGLARLEELAGTDRPPYWAYPWPGGAALVLHLRACPGIVAGRTVIDLGTGSGIVGIVAALAGAARVICVDPDPMARTACRLNAELNGLTVETSAGPGAVADVILAGDVFYGPEEAAAVMPVLAAARARGVEVLVGDIGRRDLPRDRLTALAAYPVRDVGDAPDSAAAEGGVWRFD